MSLNPGDLYIRILSNKIDNVLKSKYGKRKLKNYGKGVLGISFKIKESLNEIYSIDEPSREGEEFLFTSETEYKTLIELNTDILPPNGNIYTPLDIEVIVKQDDEKKVSKKFVFDQLQVINDQAYIINNNTSGNPYIKINSGCFYLPYKDEILHNFIELYKVDNNNNHTRVNYNDIYERKQNEYVDKIKNGFESFDATSITDLYINYSKYLNEEEIKVIEMKLDELIQNESKEDTEKMNYYTKTSNNLDTLTHDSLFKLFQEYGDFLEKQGNTFKEKQDDAVMKKIVTAMNKMIEKYLNELDDDKFGFLKKLSKYIMFGKVKRNKKYQEYAKKQNAGGKRKSRRLHRKSKKTKKLRNNRRKSKRRSRR